MFNVISKTVVQFSFKILPGYIIAIDLHVFMFKPCSLLSVLFNYATVTSGS